MNEAAIRAEIKRRKDIFRRQQAALSFTEKVRIAFAMSNRRRTLKQAKLIERKAALAPLPKDRSERFAKHSVRK